MNAHGIPCREYCIRMRLTDPAAYPSDAGITFEQVPDSTCMVRTPTYTTQM